MTFADVPVGHVFDFADWPSGLLLRKSSETTFQYRGWHRDPPEFPAYALDAPVNYDPFVALVEGI